MATKYFHQKPGGNQKLTIRHSISYTNQNEKINIFSAKQTNCLYTLLIAINTKPNGVFLVTLLMQLLNN